MYALPRYSPRACEYAHLEGSSKSPSLPPGVASLTAASGCSILAHSSSDETGGQDGTSARAGPTDSRRHCSARCRGGGGGARGGGVGEGERAGGAGGGQRRRAHNGQQRRRHQRASLETRLAMTGGADFSHALRVTTTAAGGTAIRGSRHGSRVPSGLGWSDDGARHWGQRLLGLRRRWCPGHVGRGRSTPSGGGGVSGHSFQTTNGIGVFGNAQTPS